MSQKFDSLKHCACALRGAKRGGGWLGEKRLRRGTGGEESGNRGPETFMAVRKEELYRVDS